MIRTVIVVIFIALYIALAGLPALLYALATGNDEFMFRWGRRGARWAIWLAGIRMRVEGRDKLQPGATYVFMSNHVGNVDPPVHVAVLPRVAALAKHVVWKIPVLGRALTLTGFIPVMRGTQQAAQSVDAGTRALRGGRSLLVYPEGTRSRTGEMLPFRHGVFLMAIRAGVPIVPMTILGSREIMQKGDPRIHPGEVRIVIHDPIPTANLREEDRQALSDKVREVIASALPRQTAAAPQAVAAGQAQESD